MATTTNHFITVSKQGVLMARRKGQAPVKVATAREGLRVATDDPAQTLLIHFEHGGGNRQMRVLTVETLPVAEFQARFQVDDETLGRWIRAAVERALDAAPVQKQQY